MRAIFILTAALAVACAPESHNLLGDEDAGPDAPRDCFDGADDDLHGLACRNDGTCGGLDWWSGCIGGEHAMVRIAGPSSAASCDDPMPTYSSDEEVQLVGVDGPCVDVIRCDANVSLSLCQASGRTGLRPDAAATPYLDCTTATAAARDGDPCANDLRCSGIRGGVSFLLWCDDAGVVRLLASDGIATVRP